ncbi:hypothetical protein A2872_02390 [Candidatus Gottesmanbacteria bacterium RIFCSPHIGHO2_01_FULL_42_12]|uniref:Transglutaminase-like domain-containing protein n=1 Tax=Candidatus Gottesmanbacteria bacterium RIFCSPHIGHO2_01_FULL_42_12 TaxID=1798377 RepID=A0A1F5Z5H7_9BACT|nr:MAG: hypothetical protein A2872_02390 [Candidatus Gottesmanbacteria bacterium RIFCSPHIGHO2_01_FULL_42_12]
MRKYILIFLVFLFTLSSWPVVFAQGTQEDALFAVIQRQLAGDPSAWSVRVASKKNNYVFVPVHESPQDIMRREEEARTTTDDFNTSSLYPGEILRRVALFNPKTMAGFALGDVIREFTDNRFFEGDYLLTTNETSELGKIKDLYDQTVARITRYEVGRTGSNNTLASCLRDSAGVCRHMATILQQSLKKAGVKNEQMVSPEHHWVRVTLSDPGFAGITFDLDPTRYHQAIPLAPRDNSSMSIEWSNRMLAITSSPSGTLNLNGMWRTESGRLLEIRHVGSGIVAVVKESDNAATIGRVSLTGILAKDSITGTQLFTARQCLNLERQSPTSGTVSSDGNTISLNSTAKVYYVDSCTYSGETQESNSILTRVR